MHKPRFFVNLFSNLCIWLVFLWTSDVDVGVVSIDVVVVLLSLCNRLFVG